MAVGTNFLISAREENQLYPTVSSLKNGDFVVTWGGWPEETNMNDFTTFGKVFSAGITIPNGSIMSSMDARATIADTDKAIQTVNIQRSKLGAVSNRLSHTVNNLTNISANLSAARGGIEDADFAFETTHLAKNQILQQASTAMLAQANASKQNVLSLLQG